MKDQPDDILEAARERMDRAINADLDNRSEALDDLRILSGLEQWPEQTRLEREAGGRPCLTINQLPQFLRKVTGDLRQMNPAIKVSPADRAASPDVADIIEGIVRHIEYRSDGPSVYERAGESAASCGMGFFRVLTEYEAEDSFNQDLRLESIANPFSVYVDPDAVLPTRADAEWWFITQPMDCEEFERQYPDAAESDVVRDGTTDNLSHWRNGDSVIIAEYFWKERKSANLVQFADGRVEIDPKDKTGAVQERDTTRVVINWAKISGSAVLEGPTVLPGRHIPLVAVMGEELYTGDRVYRSSVIRHAKDPQRLYNYWWSAQTEVMALQPKAPFMITATQVAGFEEFWNDPQGNRPYLPYNPDPAATGAPQRAAPPLASTGMAQMIAMAANDLRSTTGIYDASLGQRSNENSGVAIRQRQQEADVSTSIYADNVTKAVQQAGLIMLDLIPVAYDTARVVRIIGKDKAVSMAQVNQPVIDNGIEAVINDLSRGRYDVMVSSGPSFTSRREEAVAGMMEFVRVMPQAAPLLADLMAKSMDWPDADTISERLQALLPPGAAQAGQPPNQQQQQQMARQMQAQQRQMEAANIMQEIELRTKLAEAKKAEAQAAEAEADAMKARLEAMQAQLPAPQLGYQPMPQPGAPA